MPLKIQPYIFHRGFGSFSEAVSDGKGFPLDPFFPACPSSRRAPSRLLAPRIPMQLCTVCCGPPASRGTGILVCSQLPLPVTVAASSAATDELTKATDGSWLTTSAGFRVSSFLGKVGKVPLCKANIIKSQTWGRG